MNPRTQEIVHEPAADAEAAGATWVDAPVVTDGNLVTSPHPDHAAAFSCAMLTFLETRR
jgi:putative intracellular protease/amidase